MKGKLSAFNFLLLTAAGVVNSVGIKLFLAAVNLYDSGLSGLSMFLGAVCDPVPMSVFLVVLNVPFFLFGMKKQGVPFTVYSVYVVAIYSLAAFLLELAFPYDAAKGSPIAGTDLLLCAAFGGILSGIGSGMAIRFGGSLDGIEVCGVVFAKRIGLTVGNFVMAFNVILYCTIGAWFNSWQLPLYSIVAYFFNSRALDFVVDGIDRAKAAMIVTSEPEKVGQELSNAFGRGITVWQGEGFYSKAQKTVLYCVVNRFQIAKLKSLIKQHDPLAFVTITEISDVLGTSLKYNAQVKLREEKRKLAAEAKKLRSAVKGAVKKGAEGENHGADHGDSTADQG